MRNLRAGVQTHVASSQWRVSWGIKPRVSQGEAKTTLQYYSMRLGEGFASKSGDIQTHSSKDPSINERQLALLGKKHYLT